MFGWICNKCFFIVIISNLEKRVTTINSWKYIAKTYFKTSTVNFSQYTNEYASSKVIAAHAITFKTLKNNLAGRSHYVDFNLTVIGLRFGLGFRAP